MNQIISPNDVLIDETMLCEASRLLQGLDEGCSTKDKFLREALRYQNENPLGALFNGISVWEKPSNSERLFNLSMLLDALALHEHIYVLKAELPTDAEDLQLRQLLMRKGIVRELETAPYQSKIQREFNQFCRKLNAFDDSVSGSGQYRAKFVLDAILHNRTFFDEKIIRHFNPPLVSGLLQDYTNTFPLQYFANSNLRQDYYNYDHTSSYYKGDLISQPFLDLGMYLIERFDSGRSIGGVSYLRTYAYWRISEYANIALYPSSRRIPFLYEISNHIQRHSAEKVYQAVAKAFKENIELVNEDEQPIPLILPPCLAIFFDIYSSCNDLDKTIDDFRNEFAAIRKNLSALEQRLRTETKTLGERIKLKQQIANMLEQIRSAYNATEDSKLEAGIGFAASALPILSNPADPSKYAEKLLTQPLKWLRNWWKMRPLRHVFHLRKRLYSIKKYEDIASEVLEIEFDEEANQKFYKFYDDYVALHENRGSHSDIDSSSKPTHTSNI